ncbi:MAG: hypothetical protein ACI83D_000455 [Planctomycetota bacterium]|jgi:hypothetical protein
MHNTRIPQAVLCVATSEKLDEVVDFLRLHESEIEMLIHSYSRIGVDDARALREKLQVRYANPVRFVICASSITIEAQNALLKSAEELGESVSLCICVPKSDMLLPTLQSRLQELEISFDEKNTGGELSEFCKGTYQERLELIDRVLGKKAKEPWSHDYVRSFLGECLRHVHTCVPRSSAQVRSLSVVEESLQTLSLPGMPAKMVFEHVALTLPKG